MLGSVLAGGGSAGCVVAATLCRTASEIGGWVSSTTTGPVGALGLTPGDGVSGTGWAICDTVGTFDSGGGKTPERLLGELGVPGTEGPTAASPGP